MTNDMRSGEVPKSAEIVIVGGGLSGGLVAERLVNAGFQCVMLEAGRHWSAADFPLPELLQGQLFWNNGMEFTDDGRMVVLRGKCVGGSSVVNQALLDTAPEQTQERWAARTGIEWLGDGTLPRGASALLDSGRFTHTVIPHAANNGNAQRFVAGMQANGWQARQLHRAQGDCRWQEGGNCIECLGGCPRRSKQSALETTIARAEAGGLRVVSEVDVDRLRETAGGITLSVRHRGRRRELRARSVVLAAGAIGTTAILLRSGYGSALPALGQQFFVHPQFNSVARYDTPVDGHVGAFQSVASDEPRFAAQGFKLECIALPRSVMALTLPRSGQPGGCLPDYRYWAGAEASIRDTEPGRIVVTARGGTRLVKRLSPADVAKRDAARKVIADVFRAAGAREIVHGWASLSVHPMGGAALGTDRRTSVVGPDFRLHGARRIHVCDVSLFPDAIGCNPGLTVMCLAERAADEFLAQDRRAHA